MIMKNKLTLLAFVAVLATFTLSAFTISTTENIVKTEAVKSNQKKYLKNINPELAEKVRQNILSSGKADLKNFPR